MRLHTKIFIPENQTESLPLIMNRMLYGVDGAATSFVTYLEALAAEGYIFVFQDVRGKDGSEGTFVMQRPARAHGDTSALDEGTDTDDTIEWLLKKVARNNGRVGMLGVSYDGWTTIMGASSRIQHSRRFHRRRPLQTCGSGTTFTTTVPFASAMRSSTR